MDAKKILCLTGLSLAISCSVTAFAQTDVPEAVRVPDGHKVAMETVGVGQITYECQAKSDMPGQMAWEFMGPKAVLNDRSGKQVGTYYGPPATWESADGSRLTGTQVAIAPAGAGNIPHQLVKANPAEGKGEMTGVSYIQRVATQGGVAPSKACAASNKGEREIVQYQADYLFWTAN
ncbi:DUF3455 domain-containing protein [Stutzerimonas zhaodongensis]|uniref:DUF3455 domain-containing protein n=1 Tax=Stutzerimonas zhaodongensis TaxID=1176257 RepID=A0A3M2HYU2_9GAMM|nr:DUF3455 domain-containing protein [Stutzerimonas zhaodongensis]MCQ2029369.1 DUF3455 domain-containing protein [Stutzerimonas zhaodongensis]MCQ4316847.1 DUF3455 domain-containing protein [Stutzerimonas zhaodongensis]RMH92589.1 DUF3455 domain-containing protein [Stutzerimonas zhaodongensis]